MIVPLDVEQLRARPAGSPRGARPAARLAHPVHAVERRRQVAAVVRPREPPAGGLAQVVADDQVADPSDPDPQRQRDRRRVHHLEEAVAVLPHPRDVDHDRAGDAAEQRDAALPHVEPLERAGELREVRDHVRDARAEDRADQRPEQHRADVLGRDAAADADPPQEPAADHEPDRDAQAVRRDGERVPEPEPVEDGPADGRERGEGREHRERVYRRPLAAPYERRPGQSRPIARPIRSPLTTSDG